MPDEEPVYEGVAAEEVVHGVKADDKTDMVETLCTAAQATIVNVEKLAKHEEKAAPEQMLARIAAMDEEETAAFQQMLEENFPVETVEMDGVEYRFFVFEVEIETEEGLRRERYGFREEDGAWIFVKLSVAETAK